MKYSFVNSAVSLALFAIFFDSQIHVLSYNQFKMSLMMRKSIFCTKNENLKVTVYVSFFFFTLGPGFKIKGLLHPLAFASAFKFFGNKYMGVPGINNDPVPFVETIFPLNFF